MSKKILSIIESAYRATLEEQDDTVIWLTQVIKGAGASVDVLLRGNAVSYGVKGQSPPPLTFGSWKQTHGPQIDQDLTKLIQKGASVYLVQEDVAERGIEGSELIEGIKRVPRSGVAKLFSSYDAIWHW